MSFQNFKSESYCVRGRHRSATTKTYGDITSKGAKVLIGYCLICKRRKSMTVSNNTIIGEGLQDFFKKKGLKGLDISKKMAKSVSRNPSWALDITANIATAAASRKPNKIHLKCDFIVGSVVNALKQPILYSFVLDKPAGYKIFSEPETIHYTKINKKCFKKNNNLFRS